MQAAVEKGEETEHAAEANQIRQAEEFAEWRDRQSDDDEAQGPIARGVRDELDGIGGEAVVESAPPQGRERQQAESEHGHFGPFAGQ